MTTDLSGNELRQALLSFRETQQSLISKRNEVARQLSELEALQDEIALEAQNLIDAVEALGHLGSAVILDRTLAVTVWQPEDPDEAPLHIEYFEWTVLPGWDEHAYPILEDDDTVPALSLQ